MLWPLQWQTEATRKLAEIMVYKFLWKPADDETCTLTNTGRLWGQVFPRFHSNFQTVDAWYVNGKHPVPVLVHFFVGPFDQPMLTYIQLTKLTMSNSWQSHESRHKTLKQKREHSNTSETFQSLTFSLSLIVPFFHKNNLQPSWFSLMLCYDWLSAWWPLPSSHTCTWSATRVLAGTLTCWCRLQHAGPGQF